MTLNQTINAGESLSRTVLSADRLSVLNCSSAAVETGWQEVFVSEKQRFKKKESEHKRLIQRLGNDLKREQDRNLADLTALA